MAQHEWSRAPPVRCIWPNKAATRQLLRAHRGRVLPVQCEACLGYCTCGVPRQATLFNSSAVVVGRPAIATAVLQLERETAVHTFSSCPLPALPTAELPAAGSLHPDWWVSWGRHRSFCMQCCGLCDWRVVAVVVNKAAPSGQLIACGVEDFAVSSMLLCGII